MVTVVIAQNSDEKKWNDFVDAHANATLYHHFAFKSIIEASFKRSPKYLMALDTVTKSIIGILPLIHFTGMLSGNTLVSLPFFDGGGVCAQNPEASAALVNEALALGEKLGAKVIEVHQEGLLDICEGGHTTFTQPFAQLQTKVRMLLSLPPSAKTLFDSYPGKLRSQIRRAQKEDCTVREGGHELIADFYTVLCRNMRDLGSPVEPAITFKHVFDRYPGLVRIFIVYYKETPIACSLLFGFKDRVVNRWASSNRDYKQMAPNMMLYWRMLEYAIEQRYTTFDFGRSTIGETTHKFKAQWGALPQSLVWYLFGQEAVTGQGESVSRKKEFFIAVWRKLPVPLATFFGSRLRRHVSL